MRVLFEFLLRERMPVGGFVKTGITQLNAGNPAVVNHLESRFVPIVFVGEGKTIEGNQNVIAELIFGMIDNHGRQRVAAIRQCFLGLYDREREA